MVKFFDLFCVCGSEWWWGLERVSNTSLVKGLKIGFLGTKQREQFDGKFVQACVEFDVVH